MNEKPIKNGEKPIRDERGKWTVGNPGGPGRPRGSGLSITTEIKRKLEEIPEGQKVNYLQILIEKILHIAIDEGDTNMLKEIWHYIDGMPESKMKINFIEKLEELEIHENRDETNSGKNQLETK